MFPGDPLTRLATLATLSPKGARGVSKIMRDITPVSMFEFPFFSCFFALHPSLPAWPRCSLEERFKNPCADHNTWGRRNSCLLKNTGSSNA
jgi:hypothetical protein